MEKLALLLLSVQFFSVNTKDYNLNEYLFTRDIKFDFINLCHSYTSNYETSGSHSAKFCIGRTLNDEEMWKNIYKYNKTRKTILNVPTDHLIVPLIIADVSDKVNDDPNFILHKHHLDYFLNNYFGRLFQPCFVVFKFGWSKHFKGQQNFYGVDGNTKLNYPGMSGEIAKWITKSYKNVVGIGVDLPSVDPSSAAELPAFKELIDAGVYVVTNVNLDHYIPVPGLYSGAQLQGARPCLYGYDSDNVQLLACVCVSRLLKFGDLQGETEYALFEFACSATSSLPSESWCTAIITPLNIEDVCSPYRLIAVCPKTKMIKPETRLHRL